jgi:AraC family transcriptional regulator, regulatory protein of adaptative response / methylated-DNA-[protein]-cysteine methyltransferase
MGATNTQSDSKNKAGDGVSDYSDDNQRWEAVINRKKTADEKFYYAVSTTGVFCRPSCPSRLPLRENVIFHPTTASAIQAGFRACQRCKPEQPPLSQQHATMVARACRLIEQAEVMPSLTTLAKTCGLSQYHFHRVFKSITGVTPKAYGAAHRAEKVRESLSRSNSVTEAIYDTGFSSNGRFYASADHMLGMTPTTFRDAGADTSIRFAVAQCTLGAILVAATEKGVCAISMGDDPDLLVRELQDQFPRAHFAGGDETFEQMVAQVVGYVESPNIGLELPLDLQGTVFQMRVWQALREIPMGQTASYAQIAQMIGSPKSARAVAKACASNTIALAIPCHRVVRSDGALSGYRWGVERKRTLLENEAGLANEARSSK